MGRRSTYRFDGHGRVIAYEHDEAADADGRVADTWRRVEGAMILVTTAAYWTLDPWSGQRLKR